MESWQKHVVERHIRKIRYRNKSNVFANLDTFRLIYIVLNSPDVTFNAFQGRKIFIKKFNFSVGITNQRVVDRIKVITNQITVS